jgi:hypothetical protein
LFLPSPGPHGHSVARFKWAGLRVQNGKCIQHRVSDRVSSKILCSYFSFWPKVGSSWTSWDNLDPITWADPVTPDRKLPLALDGSLQSTAHRETIQAQITLANLTIKTRSVFQQCLCLLLNYGLTSALSLKYSSPITSTWFATANGNGSISNAFPRIVQLIVCACAIAPIPSITRNVEHGT